MTFVKICGLTTLEDAIAAAEAGADYLGFILYSKSPRGTSLDAAAPIVRAVRNMALPRTPVCVGVQVSPAEEDVIEALTGRTQDHDTVIMDYVQIHKIDPALMRTLRMRTNHHVY
ncbi:MAG TPA: hypothetical protein VMT34_05635, partial [Aggregatilineales bacterium]|nr:hypothetical protein [Aggregatilineales bacterium]